MAVGKLGKWGNGESTRGKIRVAAMARGPGREGSAPYMSII